ncbi:unnamed protein product [Closterium sp. NIES-54]
MSGGQQRVQAPRRIGEYEVGGTLGEGTFAKVKYAVHATTGEPVAMKVLDKEKIIRHKMVDQIKREISVMKLVRHPNVVRLYEVLASRTKIYIILEFVTGGELFDKIVNKGRLEEEEARRYFQQLIDAMEYCHSKGVAHRDLKPENLLLDSKDNIKISDFGLSALPQQVRAPHRKFGGATKGNASLCLLATSVIWCHLPYLWVCKWVCTCDFLGFCRRTVCCTPHVARPTTLLPR